MCKRWLLLIALVGTVGCSYRALVVDELAVMVHTGMSAMESETDFELAREAMPGHIKLLETMWVNDPDNDRLCLLLARLYASYAFSFLETDVEAARYDPASEMDAEAIAERAVVFYGRAEAYALRVLELNHPGLGRRFDRVNALDAVLGELGPADAPALFWYGFALGARINLSREDVGLLVRAPVAAAAMHRVTELAPTFFHGNAHLALMLYYGGRSATLGGRPDLADAHYRKLKSIAGDDFLLADVFYARHVLVNRADRDEFLRLLSATMAVEEERPEYGLMNAVARRRARIYTVAVDDFFI